MRGRGARASTPDDVAFPTGRNRFVESPRGARHRTFDAPTDFHADEDDDFASARPERRAFSTWEGPVFTGGERSALPTLRALFQLDPECNRALTHGFHPYAARMPPSLVRQAVAKWSQPGQTVLDPFCGSGTVLVEAYAQGRKAVGVDASPLAVEIALTRTTLLSFEERHALLEAGQKIAEDSADRARRRQKIEGIAAWARREHEKFFPHVFLEMFGLRNLIFEYKGPPAVVRALRMCLSSMLAKFMRQGESAPRDGNVKRIGRGVPSNFFGRRVQELANQLSNLQMDVPGGTKPPRVVQGDACDLKDVAKASVHLVVTSPPYAGVYDYGNMHASRFAWLALDQRPLLLKQIGARTSGMGATPDSWNASRRAWLAQIAQSLSPGGHAVIVAGDGVVGDAPENAQSTIWNDSMTQGLEPVAWASQERPSRDGRVREIFGNRARREHILLLRRRP